MKKVDVKQLMQDLFTNDYTQDAIEKSLDYFRNMLLINLKHYLSDFFEIISNIQTKAKTTPNKIDDTSIKELLLLIKELLVSSVVEIDKLLKN